VAAGYDGQSLTFLAPGPGFMKDNFSMDLRGSVSGRFKLVTCTVYFISIIITLAPPQKSGIRSQRLGTPVSECCRKEFW